MSIWPGSNDYTAAIQTPRVCFKDQDLKQSNAERNRLTGMPRVWTGNFAQVYELRGSAQRWAVKCFTRSNSELQSRYLALATAIATSKLPYFIDFQFLADEMLVAGKRYPVVKMQWLEGQSLDKFVESNLQMPQALLRTANQLVTLVQDLEARGFAHGDLQHGNLVVSPTGLKLVDYDGMYVPSLAGKSSGELGLPSYQHPRRSAADFGVGLDRFALLVICTGLCAVAVEPNLWYEFGTGDNLLFTSKDFRDPANSRLFARILGSTDSQVKTFAGLLRAACVQEAMKVPLPARDIDVRGPAPWWVTHQANGSAGTRADESGATHRVRNLEFRHRGAAVLTTLGALALGLAGLLDAQVGAIAAVVGGIGYLIERAFKFNTLPAIARRRELQTTLVRLRKELLGLNPKKADLERQLAALAQSESTERGQALSRLQNSHLANKLSAVPIDGIRRISGVGPVIVSNYRSAGVNNAWQLRQNRSSVAGVGEKRRALIFGLLAEWERTARVGIPAALPRQDDDQIAATFRQRRAPLLDQIANVTRQMSTMSTDVSQADWETKQLRIPSFAEFMKNTL